jgi:hypothetical protein
MPLETVKDIMLSLDEYAIVDEDATMLDAVRSKNLIPHNPQ